MTPPPLLCRFGTYLAAVALLAPALSRAAVLSIDATAAVRTVDERVFGANAAIWDSYFPTQQTADLLAAAGLRALRFPGGSASDEYHWKTNRSMDNTWEWATDFDEFAGVATQLKAHVFITANYGSGTPEEAADWVAYSNKTKGYGFKYWEIGNENYGTWERDLQAVPHDPYTYAVRFKEYMAQMKAADPSIRVGAVAQVGEDMDANNTNHPATNPRTGKTHNGWTPVMLSTMRALGVVPDYLIYHRYDGAPGRENDATLLQAARTWGTDAANLRQQLTDYLGAAGKDVELCITENNSVYGEPGKQSTSLVNGLYLADSIGNVLQTEFNSLLWWDVRNGQDNTRNNSATLYGWRQYGDYGLLSTPSNFGSSTAYEPYPTYYIFKLLAKFAREGDTVVKATSNDSLLAVFAARHGTDTLRLLVINKSPTRIIDGAISLAGFTPAASATTYSYGILEDEAARTGGASRDIATGSIKNASTGFTASFEPYSATVIVLAKGTSTGGGSGSTGGSGGESTGSGGGGALPAEYVGTLVAIAGYAYRRRRATVRSDS